ncbi:ATP-dependent helicase [Aminipila butyrica]|uniref:ATP-dependent helicase n=1 Tax=Aminipila butyrica TaxID=433296 RepID=A0A858BXK7_9FIRM|nr:DEAD/DEAH box helicase [Aminipila butyrica]QIB69838.1 ATP-dependent helicase [Aminipila butyrica]
MNDLYGVGKKTERSQRMSDRNAIRLIDLYSHKNLIDAKDSLLDRDLVRLVPKLTVVGNTPELSLTIGNTRMYVIKSIKSFCESMKRGDTLSYGRELSLTHHISRFEDSSKPLVDYIMDRYSEIESYRNDSYYESNYGYDNTKRYMRIGPNNLDRLMNLLKEQAMDLVITGSQNLKSYSYYRGEDCWKQQKDVSYRIEEHTPKIHIRVSQESAGTYLLISSQFDFLEGKDHLYIAEGEELWQTSQDFAEKTRNFVNILKDGNGCILLAERDMNTFFSNVMAQVQDHVELGSGAELLEAFMPDQGRIKIYLDSPSSDTITSKLLCEYGEGVVFDVMSGEQIFETWAGGQTDKALAGAKTVRDQMLEDKARLLLSRYFVGYEKRTSLLYLTGSDERIYEFVNVVAKGLTKVGSVFTTEKYRRIGNTVVPKASVGVRLESDLLKLDFDLDQFPIDELMGALEQYRQKKTYHRMKDGGFLDLTDESLSELLTFVDDLGIPRRDLENGFFEMPKYKSLLLNSTLKNSRSIKFDRDGHFKSLIRGMSAVEDSDHPIPAHLSGILRDYQKEGFQWLKTMTEYGFSGILADEMGLGKTLQIISLLEDAWEALMANPTEEKEVDLEKKSLAVIISPASLVLNWKKEIEKFAPNISTLAVIGTAKERKELIKTIQRENVILTSYDLFRRDLDQYREWKFDFCIIDEAQYIKNYSTQNARAVKLADSNYRFALTGTPIENRLSELWSIFDFLMPDYLFSYNKFKQKYEMPIVREQDQECMESLKRQVTPFMLRRLKKNVLKELPEKTETVIYAKLEGEQQKLYKANLAKAKLEIGKEIREGGFETNKIMILALLTRLRQLCCHPALCYEDYKQGSSKLEACMELIDEAVSGEHKVLVFSQFTSMLELIQERLDQEDISYYKLTGSTPKEQRAQMVEEFNQEAEEEDADQGAKVFLISLKAGGTGLNLTAADVVIHYDPWWNLAVQNQATDRAHRIGQKKNLQVYKIIAEDTIEEKILKLQESKRELADALITESVNSIGSLSGKDLMELLE